MRLDLMTWPEVEAHVARGGGIILPTLVIEEESDVLTVVNDQEGLTDWLRSRG